MIRWLLVASIPGIRGEAPQLPPSLTGALGNMMNVVETLVPPANNQGALQAMAEQGMDEAEQQASAAEQDTLVGQVVSTLIDARLNTFVYTGMCRRNYTDACPKGWTQSEGKCTVETIDPENPNPACESLTTDLSQTAKEEFAIKCKVQWPCAACMRDFSTCPVDFDLLDGICVPKNTYIGPCPEAIDFRKTEDPVTKARWAARCYTSWPCVRD